MIKQENDFDYLFPSYDCRQAWQTLGNMSRQEAMSDFIKQLDKLCPLFKPYVQAHKAEREEQDRKRYVLFRFWCEK